MGTATHSFLLSFQIPSLLGCGHLTYHINKNRINRLYAPFKSSDLIHTFNHKPTLKKFDGQPTLGTIRMLLMCWASLKRRRITSTESLLQLCIWVKWNSSREVVKNKLKLMVQPYVTLNSTLVCFALLCFALLCFARLCFAILSLAKDL